VTFVEHEYRPSCKTIHVPYVGFAYRAFPPRPTVALHFMQDPDTYHDESSIELQQELASLQRMEALDRRAESIRAQQQDEDDNEAE
jgi:hypothetical protein